MQKITDKPLVKCRKCGGRLEKQWSPTSFQFKGSGWYVTDYTGKKSESAEEKKSDASETAPPAAAGDSTKPGEKRKSKEQPIKTETSKTTSTSGD
jgi:predicted nucleic acid-binding Zn ribbon protein